jgi:hypothetical protein
VHVTRQGAARAEEIDLEDQGVLRIVLVKKAWPAMAS